MNSYEFEVAAKNAVIKIIHDNYNEEYPISEINLVWMVHLLGFKKAILADIGTNDRLYEVTYNLVKNEMYVDVYVKESNMVFAHTAFDMTAHA